MKDQDSSNEKIYFFRLKSTELTVRKQKEQLYLQYFNIYKTKPELLRKIKIYGEAQVKRTSSFLNINARGQI